jgi:hypothetical protein
MSKQSWADIEEDSENVYCPSKLSKSLEPLEPSDDGFTLVKKIKKCVMMKDDILFCNSCKKHFLFSVNKKKEYYKKGWQKPKICKLCCSQRTCKKQLN